MSTTVGTHEITVTATNSEGSDTVTFDITIAEQLTAPQITAISDISVAYNVAITATAVTVTGNPTPTVTVAGLPTGITYENDEITGMSTTAGTHEITITASNSEGDVTVTFDITIDAEILTALTLSTITRQDVPSGSEQTFALSSFITQGVPVTDDFSIEIPTVTSGFSLHTDNTGPHGCLVIDNEIHVIDRADALAYVYALDGTYLRSHSLPLENTSPRGIAYDPVGERIYIVDNVTDDIYILDKDYVSQGTFGLTGGNSTPEGLTFWDDLLWCIDRDRTVYPYSSDGTYNASRQFTISGNHNTPRSITHIAKRFWIADISSSSTDFVAYTESGDYDNDLDFSLPERSFGFGAYNNQFIIADITSDTVVVRDILSGVSISINDSTQVVTIDSDGAWADHEITAKITAHQANFTDPTAEFVIRLEQSIPVWDALSAATWTADSAITEINLNNLVAHEDSIALESGTLPAGVTFSNGVLSGTPTDDSDDVTLTFRATNDAGSADADLEITIGGVAPSWSALSGVSWVEGVAITNIDLGNSVIGNPTPTISLQSGTLPAGITFSNDILSGTPTDASDDVTLTFRATNDLGEADTTLAITISVSPSWTALTSQSWVLDDAITNIDLNNSVTGDGTITISLQSGTLPDGISLSSGVISGTPSDATQDGSVTFRATTSAYGTADTTLSYVINAYPSWTTLSDVTWIVGTAINRYRLE